MESQALLSGATDRLGGGRSGRGAGGTFEQAEEYQSLMKEKQLEALRRKARQFGLEVIEKTPGSGAATADATLAQR